MAEHRVRKNNIIYIIPDDELFAKWRNDEAFIDDYGRLMNRKPNRVLKELKHYVDNTPMVQQRTSAPPAAPVRNSSPVKEYIKDSVRETAMEATEIIVDRAVDAFFYEVLPNVWHKHIVPFYHRAKEALTSKELKADAVIAKSKAGTDMAVRQSKTGTKMTQEEADAEKRKVLYHWLGMLSSLKKLHDAGEIDIDSTLAQLTDQAMLKRVNGFLSENPNLLETDKYIVLHGLLGRDLYEEQQLVPIRADEITQIASKYGYDARNDKMEDNHNG
ncbi:MAG: hypothetical protein IKO03_03405 [Lachnospiraceae bacterium]|nr:hypothetical protein [Lachnospiraceae bacterium]MBR6151400.1 hypothetical protein [Lachnospiraceae bacterium]